MDAPGRPEDTPELTPEEESRIGGLLGDLHADDSLPPDVAARLDARLDELVSARPPARDPARPAWVRRHAGRLLVAAAAVVAVAVAGPPIVRQIQDPADESGSSASTADSGVSSEAGGAAAAPQRADGGVPRLRSERFRAQAAALVRSRASLTSPLAGNAPPCATFSSVRGTRLIAVLFDGDPAVLAVGPARRGTRLVQAQSCSGRVLASARVPGQDPE